MDETPEEKLQRLIAYITALHLTPVIKEHLRIHFGIVVK